MKKSGEKQNHPASEMKMFSTKRNARSPEKKLRAICVRWKAQVLV
jgi:hypothetical protein